MPLDFQIEIESLKRYLKSAIATNVPVFTEQVTIDPAQGPAYITGLDFENAILSASRESDGRTVFLSDYIGSTPNVTVGTVELPVVKLRPQFLYEVNVFYSTVTQLREAGFNEPANQTTFLPITFVLDAWADFDGNLSIVPELKEISGLPAAQQQKFQDVVNALQIPLDLSSALGIGGQVQIPRFLNAGVTLSQDGSFVTLRFEYERPNQQTWTNFFQGQTQSVLEDRQWAALIPSDLLTGPLQQKLSVDLHNNQNLTDITEPAIWWEPTAGPSGLWVTALGGSFAARYIEACPGVDLGFTVNIVAKVLVPATNQLGITFYLDVHKNLGDEVECAFEVAFALPILGIWLSSNYGNIGWAAYWGGLAVGPAVSFFFMLGYLNSSMPQHSVDLSKQLPPQFSQVGDDEYAAVFDLSAIADVLGGMALTAVGATDSALVLSGTFTVPDVTQGRLVTGLDHGFDDWADQTPCGALTYATDAVVAFQAAPPAHSVPARFAGPFVMEDPPANSGAVAPQYSPYIDASTPDAWHGGYIKVAFQGDDISADFAAAPWPCQLLLLSTVGARWMAIPAPPPVPEIVVGSPADIERKVYQGTHCLLLGSVWGRGVGKGFNPTWNVDPPINGLDYVRHWGFAISGLRPNDHVSAVKGGSLLAQGTANRAGRLGLAFFDTGPVEPVTLKLRAGEPRPNAVLQMEQTLLVRLAEIPVGGRFRTVQFDGGADALMLNVESHQGVTSYRIRGKGLPAQTRVGSVAGRGAANQIAQFGTFVARHQAEAGIVQLYQRVETKSYASGMAPVNPEA
jgi:hypothetical protein